MISIFIVANIGYFNVEVIELERGRELEVMRMHLLYLLLQEGL